MTGGDRYKDEAGKIMSATHHTVVVGARSASAHLYKRGARAVDFQLEGPGVAGCSDPQKDIIVKQAMKGTAFHPGSTPELPEHGHFHANLFIGDQRNWILYSISRLIPSVP